MTEVAATGAAQPRPRPAPVAVWDPLVRIVHWGVAAAILANATFIEVDGRRLSVPGDLARLEEDGTMTLLGRGSQCINTGGEKVFPEEVVISEIDRRR